MKKNAVLITLFILPIVAYLFFATGVNKKYGTGNSDIIHEKGFYLPNHQDLTLEQVEFISSLVNSEKNNLIQPI